MTQQYDNTNTGALFKNEQKETANHPDYKGQINVDGKEFWVSAWIKPTKKDPSKRFMSISIKPKEQSASAPVKQAAKPAGGSGFEDMDADIPW